MSLRLTATETSSTPVTSTLALRGSRTFQSPNGGAQSVGVSLLTPPHLSLGLTVSCRHSLHHSVFRQVRSDLAYASRTIWCLAFSSALTSTPDVVFPFPLISISHSKHESLPATRWPCSRSSRRKAFSRRKVFSRRTKQLCRAAGGQRGHFQTQEECRQDRERRRSSAQRSTFQGSSHNCGVNPTKGYYVVVHASLVTCYWPRSATGGSEGVYL